VPGCCLYPSLLPMLCIFCPCPLILPVSWVVSPMLPLSWVVKRVLSPTALYKPGVKLNMEEGARIVHPLQTLRCSVPFTRRRHFCLTRVLTNNHTCNFHVSKKSVYVLNKNFEVLMCLLEVRRVSDWNRSKDVCHRRDEERPLGFSALCSLQFLGQTNSATGLLVQRIERRTSKRRWEARGTSYCSRCLYHCR